MKYLDFETAKKINWKGITQKSYIFKSGYTKVYLISSKLAKKEKELEQGINIIPAPSIKELFKTNY